MNNDYNDEINELLREALNSISNKEVDDSKRDDTSNDTININGNAYDFNMESYCAALLLSCLDKAKYNNDLMENCSVTHDDGSPLSRKELDELNEEIYDTSHLMIHIGFNELISLTTDSSEITTIEGLCRALSKGMNVNIDAIKKEFDQLNDERKYEILRIIISSSLCAIGLSEKMSNLNHSEIIKLIDKIKHDMMNSDDE